MPCPAVLLTQQLRNQLLKSPLTEDMPEQFVLTSPEINPGFSILFAKHQHRSQASPIKCHDFPQNCLSQRYALHTTQGRRTNCFIIASQSRCNVNSATAKLLPPLNPLSSSSSQCMIDSSLSIPISCQTTSQDNKFITQ